MDTDSPRPSKPLLILGSLVIISIISLFLPSSWLGVSTKLKNRHAIDLAALNAIGELAKDENNNSRADWKDLLETNITTSSSTASLIKNTSADKATQAQLNDPNNLTASFSKNLYTASAYFKQQNITDTSVQQEVINNIVQAEASKLATTTYSYKDVSLEKSETKESLRAYGNSMASILEEVVTKEIIVSDLTSMNSFTTTQKDDSLSPISKNKSRVEKILKKLLSISVPPSALPYHILTLNRIAFYKDTLNALSSSLDDPVKSALAFKQYTSTVVLVLRLQGQFSNYFNMNNIVFSSTDAGYLFTAGYTNK